ncbi:hypothetical protein BJV82DRAFT_165155 [Fennellomyces sp. T-0311]|nr:hypothetical protein BJV82DRAFT_165155 [Fennellomyces sp. T-0311]
MSFQEQPYDYPVHRPALQHRITPRQQKEMSESQVIVPSMSALVPPTSSPFGGYYHAAAAAAAAAYYQLPPYLALPSQQSHRPVVFSTPIHPHQQQHQQHPAVAVHPPIHHTLENATITYDTVAEHSLQRDLVKDVFFSPAMARDSVEPSSSGSSISSQSDSESDASSRPDDDLQQDVFFSPHVTPSDLLQDDDPLFFIGLDFAEDETKKPALCLRQLSGKTKLVDLPTPPASVDFADDYVQQKDSLKRHRLHHHRLDGNKKLKVMPSDKITPPASPAVEYFDDASAEESSDEDEDDNSQHE